ncbi:MAG: hypothetical protein JNJ77_13335 [Planctomycetia bacterium]|nr:hypothetical protein [Planctomycetia bacterium]
MARRVLDRKKLRTEADAVATAKAKDVKVKKTRKTKEVDPKAAVLPKVKKVRAKKVKLPPRMRVRWCIYDGGMKPMAMFDYNQHAAAKARLAEYLEKKPGYFMQLVKELFPVTETEQAAT